MNRISLRLILITVFIILLVTVFPAAAGIVTTIDFENIVHGQSVTTQYQSQGATFIGSALVLERPYYSPSDGYPPHSGNKILDLMDGSLRVNFNEPISRVGVWYTVGDTDVSLEAYDSQGHLIQSKEGYYNYGGNSYLEVSGSNITYVIIHDSGNWISIDDLTYETQSVSLSIPEFPSVVIPVDAILGLMFVFSRRKTKI